MNKYLMSLGIAATSIFSAHTYTKTSDTFAQLKPAIVTNAHAAVDKCSLDTLLFLLNLFALESQKSRNALENCVQYVQENKDVQEAIQFFGAGVFGVMETYIEAMQKKIARRTDLTEEQEESLLQKLEDKVAELFAYIRATYYSIFYNHIAEKNPHLLNFMFDENGMISPEKRTHALPKSL